MPRPPVLVLLLVGFIICGKLSWGAEPVSPRSDLSSATAATVAGQVDRLINSHLQESGITPPRRCSDEDFLRRVSLDLTGRIPTPEEITLFALTPGDNKRAETIDRLLESTEFAATWAGYWREVVFSRATDARSRIAQPIFEQWLAEQVQAGAGWDRIAAELLTATGNTQEDGSTALIFAHAGDPAEIAAEVSRLFLGIQIQCANCHDHPYDQWKREDFHELAAFFPRIRLRRDGDTQPATFHVESADGQRDRRAGFPDPEQFFRFLDRDRDGRLTKSESQRNPQLRQRFERLIEIADKNGDGAISREELAEVPRPQPQPGQGMAEYYMPDLENPAQPGTRTEPVFFVNERSVPLGTSDLARRTALADSLTAADNPWFARAFVNRVWAEMIGEGFSTPVDDMGPERTARLPEVLDLLADGFVANGYDVRWVYRTVALTDAYQRAVAEENATADLPLFASASPTRLRGDQLYTALTQVLGGREPASEPRRRTGPGPMRPAGREFGRFAFGQLFNFDPSIPQADLTGNIPQALFMMNSPVVTAGISGRDFTVLGRILERFQDDDPALAELYLRVLGREPTDEEVAICRAHIAQAADRSQAFEDIFWSLLNSTEFLTRR